MIATFLAYCIILKIKINLLDHNIFNYLVFVTFILDKLYYQKYI